jgi:hypothetical protein
MTQSRPAPDTLLSLSLGGRISSLGGSPAPGDFEYAEIIRQAHLSSELSDKLIELINRRIEGKGEFTFKGHADVETACQRAFR